MTQRIEQDAGYRDAAEAYGPAMQRLAWATEANPQRRRELLQDMHVALWRSLAAFDGRCSLRTWVYRVIHNTAASHVARERRTVRGAASPDALTHIADTRSTLDDLERTDALDRLNAWIRQLRPTDRQVLTLYLEHLDAAAIAEVTGLSPGAVATRISRLKNRLTQHFQEAPHDRP